jgi:LPXTG-site transpeptidase (sortase) family protein
MPLMKFRKIKFGEALKTSLFFICVFAVSFLVLYLLNLVPTELKDQNITTEPIGVASTTVVAGKQYELPIRISIEKIGVNSIVQNPTTTNVYALDDLLLHGVVRYPGSGLPGQGNMFFFGHSTGLKLVNNQAFREFNGLKNLVAGDTILVYGDKHVYTYKVNNLKLANSNDVLVDFSVKKNMLTLSTCNTFGEKQERYVVEADYVGSEAL